MGSKEGREFFQFQGQFGKKLWFSFFLYNQEIYCQYSRILEKDLTILQNLLVHYSKEQSNWISYP